MDDNEFMTNELHVPEDYVIRKNWKNLPVNKNQ
jgi:hypothetical protein